MRNEQKFSERIFISCMLVWPALHWIVFKFYMNLSTITMSFKRFNMYTGNWDFVGLKNYAKLFKMIMRNAENFGIAFRNTFLWLGLNVFVIVPLALVVAYFLCKKIPFYRQFATIFFIPNIISIVILTMVWSFMWNPTQGAVNSILGIMGLDKLQQVWLGDPKYALGNVFLYCVWAGIGYNNLIISGAIGRIPKDIFEASEIDGVSRFQEFIHIVIPQVWSTISTVVILGAAAAFRVFLQPKLLTNGMYNTTSVSLKVVTVLTEDNNYGLSAATGLAIGVLGFISVYIIKYFLDKKEDQWS